MTYQSSISIHCHQRVWLRDNISFQESLLWLRSVRNGAILMTCLYSHFRSDYTMHFCKVKIQVKAKSLDVKIPDIRLFGTASVSGWSAEFVGRKLALVISLIRKGYIVCWNC